MRLLLPPSETKRDGGTPGTRLDLTALSFPALTAPRRRSIAAVRALARDPDAMAVALKLGATQASEVARNRRLTTSAVMPAIDRFDGVLFDALDAATLTPAAREFAGEHLVIASALFGLVGALDPIPAYRLSPDSRLPGLPLGRLWREPVGAVIGAVGGLVLDLRSEAYAALGSAPGALFVRVVAHGADGRRRALNHFNKAGKGALVRRLLLAGIDHPDADSLLAWARSEAVALEPGAPGELDLVV
ncbi:MAG TPA: peroxide stress protein YaaA [Pseudolysinimonas sp.]|nr:peroxide stress protein YaaA [Pseudolysinimonas sp.]